MSLFFLFTLVPPPFTTFSLWNFAFLSSFLWSYLETTSTLQNPSTLALVPVNILLFPPTWKSDCLYIAWYNAGHPTTFFPPPWWPVTFFPFFDVFHIVVLLWCLIRSWRSIFPFHVVLLHPFNDKPSLCFVLPLSLSFFNPLSWYRKAYNYAGFLIWFCVKICGAFFLYFPSQNYPLSAPATCLPLTDFPPCLTLRWIRKFLFWDNRNYFLFFWHLMVSNVTCMLCLFPNFLPLPHNVLTPNFLYPFLAARGCPSLLPLRQLYGAIVFTEMNQFLLRSAPLPNCPSICFFPFMLFSSSLSFLASSPDTEGPHFHPSRSLPIFTTQWLYQTRSRSLLSPQWPPTHGPLCPRAPFLLVKPPPFTQEFLFGMDFPSRCVCWVSTMKPTQLVAFFEPFPSCFCPPRRACLRQSTPFPHPTS